MKNIIIDIRKFLWRILWQAARLFGYILPDGRFRIWWFFYPVGALWLAQMPRADIETMKRNWEESTPIVRAIAKGVNSQERMERWISQHKPH